MSEIKKTNAKMLENESQNWSIQTRSGNMRLQQHALIEDKMKRVAIIGLGWLGLPLAQYLQAKGWQVKGSKRTVLSAADIQAQGIACYPFKLGEKTAQAELLRTDALIINLPPSPELLSNYVSGIKTLILDALKQGIQHLVFVSSTAVFPQQDGDFDEQSETHASSAATQALIELETWLKTLTIDCDIVRPAGLFGENRHPVTHLAGKQNLANPHQPVNLVHRNDVIRAIALLLAKPAGMRLYHLSAPSHPTRKTYYTAVAKQLGLALPHFIDEAHSLKRIIKGDKICQELGFRYHYPI